MSKPGRRWTGEDIQKLKSLAQKYPTASIAGQLGRSVSALAVKAHELKVSLRVKKEAEVHPSPSRDPGPLHLLH
jgi:hypothetical protein